MRDTTIGSKFAGVDYKERECSVCMHSLAEHFLEEKHHQDKRCCRICGTSNAKSDGKCPSNWMSYQEVDLETLIRRGRNEV